MTGACSQLAPARAVTIISSDAIFKKRAEAWCLQAALRLSPQGEAGAITLLDLDSLPRDRWPACVDEHTLLLSSFEQGQAIDVLRGIKGSSHILAKGTALEEKIVVNTLRRMTQTGAGDLANFLTGAAVTRHVISDYAKKQSYVEAVRRAAMEAGTSEEGAGHAATVAWELVMNGLFNAPRDGKDQRAKYRDVARHVPLKVEAHEAIELSFAAGQQMFGIAVRDHFGSLRRDDILANMERAERQGREQILTEATAAGAGVGLYMLHRLCVHLEFEVCASRYTEVRAFLTLSRRYRAMQDAAHSLNLYFIDPQEV